MKPSFQLIILILIAIPIPLMSFTKARIEKQKYRVVKKDKEFEIRFYPPAIFATTRSAAKSYRELGSSGFRKIAGYIFGNNETSAKIAMTAPVHMDINEKGSSMSFVMPSEYSLDKLPRPADTRVELHESPAVYMAAIEFSGYANDQKIKQYADQLSQIIIKKGIKTIGSPTYLGYNAPYEIIGRKNEVVIAIEWKE
ncbi:MAG: SOUL family heme-binding protein [Bacteroidota bacterium]